MFDDSFFDHICSETNRNAEQMAAEWIPTTKEEIMAFIGILIFMSIVQVRILRVCVCSIFFIDGIV